MFGAWLRKTEYTADRVGLLCCAGIDDAIGAISITTFHAIGRRVDMHVLAEQRRKLDAEPALRMGEWIGGMPYATNRLDALRRFDASSLAAGWRMRLATERVAAVPPPVALPDAVSGRDCAGVWRRTAAFVVDLAIISAIVRTPLGVTLTGHARAFPAVTSQLGSHALLVLLAYFVYGALLVGISGQTLGMMIFELRVVTARFARPSPAQAAWRYAVAFGSLLTAIALVGFFIARAPARPPFAHARPCSGDAPRNRFRCAEPC